MEFIDSLLVLSEQTGWEPIDIYFFSMLLSIFLWEFVPWFLSWIVRGFIFFVRWLRSHRKQGTD